MGRVTEIPGILFGVAGWSYPDWKDVVYPRNCKDTLRAVAQQVDLIEINSSFYRPPSAANCQSWMERTADFGTRFTAKLPREFTHQGVRDPAFAAKVRAGFLPLTGSDRFVGFLAQFNYQFEFGDEALRQVELLATTFGQDAQLVVEVRHRSWNAPQALAALGLLGVGVAALDYPGMASGFSRDVTEVNGRTQLAYFRLHGRNPAWFKHDAGRDQVYDWEYSGREVQQIEARLQRIAKGAGRTVVVANNHFHGKAMRLVEELVAWYRGGEAGPPSG
jgi:uncharacterized protein YecE (DUF72 family)